MKILSLENWKFTLENNFDIYTDPWAPEFDDKSWNDVIIPHDWAVSFPFSTRWSSGTGYLPGGTGWYRTSFCISEDWDGEKAFICIQRKADFRFKDLKSR